MSQYAFYPSSASGNPSVGVNGAIAPTSSTEVAGIDPNGDLHPLQTDLSGNLLVSITTEPGAPFHVIVDSSALPAGAATSANQTNGSQETQIVQGGNTAIVTAAGAVTVDGSAVTQPVSAVSLPLPTGASTAENQTNGSQTTQINEGGNTAIVTAAGALTVDGSAVTQPVSAASLPLPTGAATSANQTNGSQETQIVQGGNTATVSAGGALKVDASASTQPVSGTVTVVQPTGTNLHAVLDAGSAIIGVVGIDQTTPGTTNLVEASNFPTTVDTNFGASGASTLRTAAEIGNATGAADFNAGAAGAQTLRVVVASGGAAPGPSTGRALANAPVRNDYTSVNVTTAAFVQLIASTSNTANLVEVFDSSGQTMALAVGAAASEVIQFYIFPGGNGQVPLAIPSGSRVSIKAISATASVGEIDVNLYS